MIKSLKKIFKPKLKMEELLSIYDLKEKISGIKNTTMKEKKDIRIVFIDDEGYDIDTIKSMGYIQTEKIMTFEDMKHLEIYDVIFCDINGVGVEFDPINQGAALARMIKENYPEKIVVIYTSKNQNVELVTKYNKYVDKIVEKNSAPSKIADTINELITQKNNPIAYWENMQIKMLDDGISSKSIALIEHFYVKSILENKDYSKEMKNQLMSKEDKYEKALIFIECISKVVSVYIKMKYGA